MLCTYTEKEKYGKNERDSKKYTERKKEKREIECEKERMRGKRG